MPRIIITENAVKGLERCRLFLKEKDPLAAKRAALAISQRFALLEKDPEIGRPVSDIPELRELLVEFGNSGYVALYKYSPKTTTVYVLAFKQQKEAGY